MRFRVRRRNNGWWLSRSAISDLHHDFMPYEEWCDTVKFVNKREACIFASRFVDDGGKSIAYCHEAHPNWWSEECVSSNDFMGKYHDGRPEFIRKRYGTMPDWPVRGAEGERDRHRATVQNSSDVVC